MTGNTIVDAVYQNLEIAKRKRKIHHKLEIDNDDYFLATVHRQKTLMMRRGLGEF